MTDAIEHLMDTAGATQILSHLLCCDVEFVKNLGSRVDIASYAQKLASNATKFEAWSGGSLVGLLAAYFNDSRKNAAFITNVSVVTGWTHQGVAASLVRKAVEHAKVLGLKHISLEVARANSSAVKLYTNSGFAVHGVGGTFMDMTLYLERRALDE